MPIMRVSVRWPLLIAAVLAGAVATGCSKSTPHAITTPAATGSVATGSASTPPALASSPSSADYCTLAETIATQSGVMVNKHFIPQSQETLDMFKAVVTLSLAAKDQLEASLPSNMQPDFQVALQYFQALKDSNYSAAPPAGFAAANNAINAYGVATCGFVFDK